MIRANLIPKNHLSFVRNVGSYYNKQELKKSILKEAFSSKLIS